MGDRWDIVPSGVQSVLAKVGGHVTDGHGGGDTLEHHVKDFGNNIENAAKAAASGPIGTALKEFVDHYSPTIEGMATKTGKCIQGAVDVTKYYIKGDLEMALKSEEKVIRAHF